MGATEIVTILVGIFTLLLLNIIGYLVIGGAAIGIALLYQELTDIKTRKKNK